MILLATSTNLEKKESKMTQQEKEIMFLDLNSVLVKFWIEQGRPDKEVRIELLERMLNWQKKMGTITLDGQSKEPVSEDLEEAARLYAIPHFMKDIDVNYIEEYPYDSGLEAAFKAGAEWQKKQMGEQARKELAKTDLTLADLVAFDEGCKLGRRLERQDMLKDAVEVIVVENYGCEKGEDGEWRGVVTPTISFETTDFSFGDKVKIVIIPEKED